MKNQDQQDELYEFREAESVLRRFIPSKIHSICRPKSQQNQVNKVALALAKAVVKYGLFSCSIEALVAVQDEFEKQLQKLGYTATYERSSYKVQIYKADV